MSPTIHQAIYGERNGGHALLVHSAGNTVLFKELTPFTDLPSNSPAHINWEPYVSGYVYQNHYIISKTFPDPEAARPGMVFTHALIMELEDATRLNDLTPVLQLLPNVPKRNNSVSTITLDDSKVVGSFDLLPYKIDILGFRSVVQALLNNTDAQKPVVWIGQEGFLDIVCALWITLWPEARKNVTFRLSFAPQDAEHQRITLVATPEKLENRWSDFPKVRRMDQPKTTSLAEAFLLRLPEGEPLRQLATDLESFPAQISDLKKLEICHRYLTKLEEASPDALRTLIRFLGILSPDHKKGTQFKDRVLKKFAERTQEGRVTDIMGLRNLDTSPFENGSATIEEAITFWVQSNIHASDKAKANENAELIAEAFESSNVVWNKAVLKGVAKVLKDWQDNIAQVIWTWWQHKQQLLKKLNDLIPNSDQAEYNLLGTCPTQLVEEFGELVCLFAVKRKWYRLHAAVVSAYLKPQAAFRKQLQVDQNKEHLDGLRLLSQKVPAQEVLNVALSDLDNRLQQAAGDTCAQNSALLSQLDIKNKVWRRILFYSLNKNHHSWEGIQEPEKLVHALMDRVLQDEKVEDDLLLKIAEMSRGSLINYPKRSALWIKFDGQIARAFLQATADDWIKRFQSNPGFETSVEKALEDIIFSPINLSKILDPSQPNLLSVGITLFTHFERLNQDDFNNWLRNVLTKVRIIDLVTAVMIGELIKRRRWQRAAYIIYHNQNRDDLQPALKECAGLLDWFDQFLLNFSIGDVSTDDWWKGLTDVAVELYPHGLDDQQIWKRADGDSSIVNHYQDGRSQWEFALRKLHQGGGGKDINRQTLLKQMQKDYPNNKKLAALVRWKDRL